jgi:hypothetical protein
LIDGSATFTMATSRMTMNWAVTIRASALQRRSFVPVETVESIFDGSSRSLGFATIANTNRLARYT